MGNKPATTTTTQVQSKNPWDPAIKPVNQVLGSASDLASNVSNFTPTTSDQTRSGIDMLTGIAQGGQPGGYDVVGNITNGTGAGFQTGLDQLQRSASGGMLGANQFLDPVMQRTLGETADKVNGQFTAGGRYGSGAHSGTLTKELGNTASNMMLSNYNTERAAQNNAARTLYGGGISGAQFAGQLDALQKNPALTMLQAGGLQDQISNAERTAPMNATEWLSKITTPIAGLGGTSNSVGTQQTVQPTNWLTTGLGIGASALGAMSGNPMALANLGSNMGGLMNFGGSGGGMVNGWANNDPGGMYYA